MLPPGASHRFGAQGFQSISLAAAKLVAVKAVAPEILLSLMQFSSGPPPLLFFRSFQDFYSCVQLSSLFARLLNLACKISPDNASIQFNTWLLLLLFDHSQSIEKLRGLVRLSRLKSIPRRAAVFNRGGTMVVLLTGHASNWKHHFD